MQELFLLTECSNAEVSKATRLLQGFCEMAPVPVINRRLLWEAPRVPKQEGFDPQFLTRQRPQRLPLWRSLQGALTRQAYYVVTSYGISRDQFGSEEAVEDADAESQPTLDGVPGTLYWSDWPDPRTSKPVNSRSAAAIDNERGLCSLLRSMGYRLVIETVEEGYRFIHGNVIISILRYLDLPSNTSETSATSQPLFRTALPQYDSLLPVDHDNKWILRAMVNVLDANNQGDVQKGTEELSAVKEAFESYFDFPILERKMLDTRVRSIQLSS